MKPVRIAGFRGMANFPVTPAALTDDRLFVTPQILLNADPTDGGVLIRRSGYRKICRLNGCHSLWSDGDVVLFVAPKNGQPCLYRLFGDTPQEIGPAGGPPAARMSYAAVGEVVYLSNGHWTGAYEVDRNLLRNWGLSLPPAPAIATTDGNLPPGRYKLCYTYYRDGRLSGNGPVTQVEYHGDTFGVRLLSPPEDVWCWITQPNGGDFYLAPVNEDHTITEPYYTQPLPTFNVIPPPPFRDLTAVSGRIWGCHGKTLFYSHEFRYEDFSVFNTIPFDEELVLLAPISDGIFVCSRNTTWLLKGHDPAKMSIDVVGEGAIPGTLTYALLESGGYEISRKWSQKPTPIWADRNGLVAGSATGHLVHLTKNRLRFWPMSKGAAVSCLREGRPLILVTLSGTPAAPPDADTQQIIRHGRFFPPPALEHQGSSLVTISGEGETS